MSEEPFIEIPDGEMSSKNFLRVLKCHEDAILELAQQVSTLEKKVDWLEERK